MFRLVYSMPLGKVCATMLLLLPLWAYLRICIPRKLFGTVNLCGLFLSAAVILYLTVFNRSIGVYDVVLLPFASLAEAKIEPERYRTLLMNVFLFFPFGMTAANAIPDKFRSGTKVITTIVIGCALSISVEYIQYRFSIGMAETDDVICNTFGTCVGSLSILLSDIFAKSKKK